MISEVDLRDWDKVDCDTARLAVENLYEFEKAVKSYAFIIQFIESVEKLRNSQLAALNKQVPALLRKPQK